MGTYEAYTAIASGIINQLEAVQREVHIMANQRTVRIIEPSQWMSTEKPDLSFHTCTDRCVPAEDENAVEVCEVTEEELRCAYNKAASLLSSVRFMMGVPGVLGHDDGIESYAEAKRRVDEKAEQLKLGTRKAMRSTS